MGTQDSSAKDDTSAEAHREHTEESVEQAAGEPRAASSSPGDGTAGAVRSNAPHGSEGGDGSEQELSSAEDLAAALAEVKQQVAEHWESVLRARAELDNLRKRAQRDVENAHKFGLERLVAELLPVHDSMELGLKAAEERDADIAAVREGVALTLKMFDTALEKHGVTQIDPLDEAFDPEYHQAMSVQELEGAPSGTVTAVMQKGFTLNGRLVRPALVMVAK